MSYFKAKVHQIRFHQELCPRHRCGSLQHCPAPGSLAGFKGSNFLREGREEGEGRVRKRRGGEEDI